jgi:hypothetical protein
MNYAAVLIGMTLALTAVASTEASAVTCARGVVRAGCAGPNGAVVVRRPVVVAPRAVVVTPRPVVVVPVAPRCGWVNGVRVCR